MNYYRRKEPEFNILLRFLIQYLESCKTAVHARPYSPSVIIHPFDATKRLTQTVDNAPLHKP